MAVRHYANLRGFLDPTGNVSPYMTSSFIAELNVELRLLMDSLDELRNTVSTLQGDVTAVESADPNDLHLPWGLSVGQLSDPYVLATRALAGGSLAAGNYECGITSLDVDAKESFAQQVTVNGVPLNGKIEVDIVPVSGATAYRLYLRVVAGSWTKIGDVANTFQLTLTFSILGQASSAPPATNATKGSLLANIIVNSTILGGPSNFFLNLGNADNSQAAFFFSDHKGIIASFQSKGTGGAAPAGGKSELDIAMVGDAMQLIVAPFASSKELDIFVNNTLVALFQGALVSLLQNTQLATGKVFALLDASSEWDLVNSTGVFQFNRGATMFLSLELSGTLRKLSSGAGALEVLSTGNTTLTPTGIVTSGAAINSGTELRVANTRVVGPQQGAITDMTGTADLTYDSVEQNMLNDLKGKLNALFAALRVHGLIAT